MTDDPDDDLQPFAAAYQLAQLADVECWACGNTNPAHDAPACARARGWVRRAVPGYAWCWAPARAA